MTEMPRFLEKMVRPYTDEEKARLIRIRLRNKVTPYDREKYTERRLDEASALSLYYGPSAVTAERKRLEGKDTDELDREIIESISEKVEKWGLLTK